MIEVEYIAESGDNDTGDHRWVDENSAAVLVERGVAKIVKPAEVPAVESGGSRARELNAAAAAEAEQSEAESESESVKTTTSRGKK